MKKEVYVKFEVEADNIDKAQSKVLAALQDLQAMTEDTILLEDKQDQIKAILSTFKIVNQYKL